MGKNKKSRDKNPQAVSNRPNNQDNSLEVISAEVAVRSGPLPSPDDLAQYENILPGAADRVIRMAEEQARHRRLMENKYIDNSHKQKSTGQFYALLIGLGAIIIASLTAFFGAHSVASIMAGVGSLGLVTAFLSSKKNNNKN